MIIISHRGNLKGPNPEKENTWPRAWSVIDCNRFYVELDVWYRDCAWWLGHDTPERPVDSEYLMRAGVILHAKNIQTASALSNVENCPEYFMHDADVGVLTSRKRIWTATIPAQIDMWNTILVLHDLSQFHPGMLSLAGICTDYPLELQELVKKCA